MIRIAVLWSSAGYWKFGRAQTKSVVRGQGDQKRIRSIEVAEMFQKLAMSQEHHLEQKESDAFANLNQKNIQIAL